MIIATAAWIQALGVCIPLVVVVGIFIVWPLAGRRFWQDTDEQINALRETQTKILEELQAVRTKLDAVEHTLSAVD
jgi:hypothetical protein